MQSNEKVYRHWFKEKGDRLNKKIKERGWVNNDDFIEELKFDPFKELTFFVRPDIPIGELRPILSHRKARIHILD